MSLERRLEHLESLEDGWYDGKGKKPTPEAIESAQSYLKGMRVYPCFDGGVQIESSGGEIEIKISPDGSRSLLVLADIP